MKIMLRSIWPTLVAIIFEHVALLFMGGTPKWFAIGSGLLIASMVMMACDTYRLACLNAARSVPSGTAAPASTPESTNQPERKD